LNNNVFLEKRDNFLNPFNNLARVLQRFGQDPVNSFD